MKTGRNVLLVSAVLPAEVRNHVEALESAGLLRAVVTGYVFKERGWIERVAGLADGVFRTRVRERLRQRPEITDVDPSRIRRRPLRALYHVWRLRGFDGQAAVARTDHTFIIILKMPHPMKNHLLGLFIQ